jgi:proteasome accessory factor C
VSGRSGPAPADQRLRRLLVMLPWLMERGSVPLAEVADHFGATPAEVARDLELASLCGLPPFVDELIDVFIDDETVVVGVPRLFTRPLRLTSPEAFAVLAAGRAASGLPGTDADGPLARALAKVAAAIGEDPAQLDDVDVDLAAPPEVEVLRAHVADADRLRIRYWSASSDTESERTIVPRRLVADRGHWYVIAWDDGAADHRTFRIDRIREIRPTGERDPDAGRGRPMPEPGRFFVDADVERVVLRLAPSAGWVVDTYPVDEVRELDDGRLEVRLPVTGRRWLERLLLRLGGDGEVVEPASWCEVGREAAARLLERYERS